MLDFNFETKPKAIQSFRFTKSGRKYQPVEVLEYKKFIALNAKIQLPKDFKMFENGVAISIRFVFPPLKSWSKKKIKNLQNGIKIYKITRPDTDNLMKGFFDSLNGIIYKDDSQIVKIEAEKIYDFPPRIEMCVCDIEEFEQHKEF